MYEENDTKESLMKELEKLQEENIALKEEVRKARSVLPRIEHLSVFNDAFKDLFSEISHEINNPVNFVMSSISIIDRSIKDYQDLMNRYKALKGFEENADYQDIMELEKDIDLDLTEKELKDALSTIRKGFDRIQEVAYNLSLMGKQKEAYPQKMDVNENIEDTLFLIKSKLGETIKVETKLSELPQITSYRGKLNQVFLNVLQNAIEAINEKPLGEEGLITIESSANEKEVTIRISDDGHGMTEESREKIFERFYTTKSPEKGTGLGMSVTKDIVDMHQGKIAVESEPGKGTTIIITLPLDHTPQVK